MNGIHINVSYMNYFDFINIYNTLTARIISAFVIGINRYCYNRSLRSILINLNNRKPSKRTEKSFNSKKKIENFLNMTTPC